jgi:transcriptional regulator with XRE-family HTH domain
MKRTRSRARSRARIARLIRRERIAAQLSQEDLARLAGWHPLRQSRIESGRQGVLAEDMEALAMALGKGVSALYGEDRQS